MIKEPQSTAQFYETLKSKHCTFVEFYNPSLQCCKKMDPFIQNTCKENNIALIKVNTDKLPTLKSNFKIETIPTYVLLDKDGKVLDSKPGAQKDHVMQLIEQCRECKQCK